MRLTYLYNYIYNVLSITTSHRLTGQLYQSPYTQQHKATAISITLYLHSSPPHQSSLRDWNSHWKGVTITLTSDRKYCLQVSISTLQVILQQSLRPPYVGLAKTFIGDFPLHHMGNPNELFGQPNTYPNCTSHRQVNQDSQIYITCTLKIHIHQNDNNNSNNNKHLQGFREAATLMHCDRNIFKWYSHFGKQFGSLESQTKFPNNPTITLLGIYLKEIKIYVHTMTNMGNVHSITIHNQKCKRYKCPTGE